MKFLEDPMQTMGAGFALALVLIVVYLGIAGVGAGEADWAGIIIRWIHFLAGITWIGLLYFFNLINAAFLKSLDGPTKNVVIPKLMPSALNWFRHGATVTVLAGILLYIKLYMSEPVAMRTSEVSTNSGGVSRPASAATYWSSVTTSPVGIA